MILPEALAYISILSLNLKIALPSRIPSTASGMPWKLDTGASGRELAFVTSVMRTRPDTLTDSMRAGTSCCFTIRDLEKVGVDCWDIPIAVSYTQAP